MKQTLEQVLEFLTWKHCVLNKLKQTKMENINQQLTPKIMENQNLVAQQPQQNLQLLIDIAAEAKRAQRSEQHYLQQCADLDNTVHSLKHERETLLQRNNELMGQLTQLTAKLNRRRK